MVVDEIRLLIEQNLLTLHVPMFIGEIKEGEYCITGKPDLSVLLNNDKQVEEVQRVVANTIFDFADGIGESSLPPCSGKRKNKLGDRSSRKIIQQRERNWA